MAAANGFVLIRPDARYGDAYGSLSANGYSGNYFVAPGSGQLTITEIGCYGYINSENDVEFAIYTHDAVNGCPESQVANSLCQATLTTTPGIFHHSYGTKPVVTGGQGYWLCYGNIPGGTAYVSRFASGGTSAYLSGFGDTWPTSSDTWNTGTRDSSMFAVYTAGGGTEYEKAIAGAFTFTGNLRKKTSITPDGVFTFSGTVGNVFTQVKSLAGAFTFSGTAATIRTRVRSFAGAFTLAGDVVPIAKKQLAGAFTFAGSVVKKTSVSLAGVFTATGILVTARKMYKALAGVFTFTGGVVKKTSIPLAGVFTFTGTVVKKISVSLAGAFTFAGDIVSGAKKQLAGVFTFTGGVIKKTSISLAGVFSFSGSISKLISISLVGVVTFSGSIRKAIKRALAGVLTFTGIGTGRKVAWGVELSEVHGELTQLDTVCGKLTQLDIVTGELALLDTVTGELVED